LNSSIKSTTELIIFSPFSAVESASEVLGEKDINNIDKEIRVEYEDIIKNFRILTF